MVSIDKMIGIVIGVVLLMLASVELIPLFQNGSAELGLIDMPFNGLFGSDGIIVLAFVGSLVVLFIGIAKFKNKGGR